MSRFAIMPLDDYVATCNKIREKTEKHQVIVDNKEIHPTAADCIEFITTETLKSGAVYSVKYTDASMLNYDEGGSYVAKDINVQGKNVLGFEVVLPHPIGEDKTYPIYVYQDGNNIMLYITETVAYYGNRAIYITLEKSSRKIVSQEVPEKIDEVYQAGEIEKKREIWDNITANNTRTDYNRAFYSWGCEYIKPPYTIKPTSTQSLYQTFAQNKTLKKIEAQDFDFSAKERGTSSSMSLYYTFQNCVELEEIEDIGIQSDFSLSSTFTGCKKLKKVEIIRVDENTVYSAPTFTSCENLEDVTFEGVIGQNGLNFQWSPNLTIESIRSIIACLKDYSLDTSETIWKVTLGATNYAKLTAQDLENIDKKGWVFE